MGGIVLGILVWQEGGEAVGTIIWHGGDRAGRARYWLVRRSRQGGLPCSTLACSSPSYFRLGVTQQMLQQIALGGVMIVLPMYLQMVLEYSAMQAGLSLAPLSLSMFAVALLAGRKAGKRRPSKHRPVGFPAPRGRASRC